MSIRHSISLETTVRSFSLFCLINWTFACLFFKESYGILPIHTSHDTNLLEEMFYGGHIYLAIQAYEFCPESN